MNEETHSTHTYTHTCTEKILYPILPGKMLNDSWFKPFLHVVFHFNKISDPRNTWISSKPLINSSLHARLNRGKTIRLHAIWVPQSAWDEQTNIGIKIKVKNQQMLNDKLCDSEKQYPTNKIDTFLSWLSSYRSMSNTSYQNECFIAFCIGCFTGNC